MCSCAKHEHSDNPCTCSCTEHRPYSEYARQCSNKEPHAEHEHMVIWNRTDLFHKDYDEVMNDPGFHHAINMMNQNHERQYGVIYTCSGIAEPDLRPKYETLGDIAAELRLMAEQGMTRESIEYALDRTFHGDGTVRNTHNAWDIMLAHGDCALCEAAADLAVEAAQKGGLDFAGHSVMAFRPHSMDHVSLIPAEHAAMVRRG